MKKTLTIILLMILILFVLAIVALAATASMKVYFVRDASGATLFWRADEAYLFLGSGHTGYHFSYWEYPLALFEERFHRQWEQGGFLLRTDPRTWPLLAASFAASEPVITSMAGFALLSRLHLPGGHTSTPAPFR